MTVIVAVAILGPAFAAPGMRWVDRASMPTTRHEFAYAKARSDFYVMAGFAAGVNTVPLVDVYDLAEDAWTQAPALPYAPNHAMGAAKDGVVYNLGGYLAATSVPTDRAVALIDGAWTELPVMPEARVAGAAQFLGGKLYVVGGVGPDGVVDDVFVFDPAAQEWSTLPGPPTKLEHLALVKHEGRLYAVAAAPFPSNRSIRRSSATTRRRDRGESFRPYRAQRAATSLNDWRCSVYELSSSVESCSQIGTGCITGPPQTYELAEAQDRLIGVLTTGESERSHLFDSFLVEPERRSFWERIREAWPFRWGRGGD